MKNFIILFILCLALIVCFVLNIVVGGTDIALADVIKALLNPSSNDVTGMLIWDLRIPRALMAVIVGASLAGCGVVFQAILRNPLAEPYTLGVSGGGALAATIAIVMGLSGIAMVVMCFAGCMISIFLVTGMAAFRGFSNTMLILSGVILSFLFSSCVMLIFSLSSSRDVYASIMWLMGSLGAPQGALIKTILYLALPALLLMTAFSRDLNVLSLGDEKAMLLGLDAKKIKFVLFMLSSFITAVCVSVSGVISFIGLVVPHVMRKITGPDHRILLPASLLAGSSILVLSDMLAQYIIRPLELPVGVVTGILGGVFFVIYLVKAKQNEVI